MKREFEDYLDEGAVYFKKDDFENSIKSYSKAIEIKAHYEDAYFYRGLAKTQLNDIYGAIEDFTKAIEINPSNEENYIERGTTKLYDGSDFKGAIEDFTKAIEINPMNKFPYLHRGRAKHHLGNIGGANKDFAIYNHKNWQKKFLEMKSHSPSDVKLLMEGAKGLKDGRRLGVLQVEYEKLKKIQENEQQQWWK